MIIQKMHRKYFLFEGERIDEDKQVHGGERNDDCRDKGLKLSS